MATLRKRLDKWEAQVRKKGYLPHSKSFVHKRDALLWARSLERSMDLGDHLPPRLSTQTLGDVLLRYAQEITPLKRAGTPNDISKSVVFFCLEGGEHITGETLISDAGMHLSLPR